MISSVLDTVLDRTVVAGFTNVGYRIRSRGWTASELRRMQGEVVLVTGASSGLGLAAAEGFARLGASVWLVVRSRERGEEARARIVERSSNGDVHVGGLRSQRARVRAAVCRTLWRSGFAAGSAGQ